MKIIFITFLFLNQFVFTQNDEKMITFDNNENIKQVSTSENYFTVLTKLNKSRNHNLYLYSKSGNLVQQKSYKDYYILDAYVSEPTKQFIIVKQNACDEGEEKIIAYGLKNGEQLWETCINGGGFELSPNKDFLINRSPDFEGKTLFEIVILKNGEKILSTKNYNNFHATWLDNERVVIIQPQSKINPTRKEWMNQRKEKSAVIYKKLDELNGTYEKGLLEKEEYTNQRKKLYREKRNLDRKIIGKRRISKAPHKFIPKAAKLIIYNFKQDIIEIEKEIFSNDGKEIAVIAEDIGFNFVSVDKGSIIIYGFEIDNDLSKTDCFIKVDLSGEPIWKHNIKWRQHIITKINSERGLLFNVYNLQSNTNYVLDVGEERELKEERLLKPIKNIIDYQKTWTKSMDQDKMLNIDWFGNKISLTKEESNEK